MLECTKVIEMLHDRLDGLSLSMTLLWEKDRQARGPMTATGKHTHLLICSVKTRQL